MTRRYPRVLMLEVMQEDISAGIRGDPQSCPVARAVMRRFGVKNSRVIAGFAGVTVYRSIASLFPHEVAEYKIDAAMAKFILAFDSGEEVSPVVLRLEKR